MMKPLPSKTAAKLDFGAFPSADADQHRQVGAGQRTVPWIVCEPFGKHAIDHEQPCAGGERAPAIAQDQRAALVVPVMQDCFHQQHVGSGNFTEEVADDEACTFAQVLRCEVQQGAGFIGNSKDGGGGTRLT